MLTLHEKCEVITKRLDEIGCPKSQFFTDRLYPVLHRLTLLPEDGTDLADLVGEINERCDRAGVPEWEPIKRLEHVIADRDRLVTELSVSRHELGFVREELAEWRNKCDRATKRRDELALDVAELKASLEAERAQLAAATPVDCDELLNDFTRLLLRDGDAATEFLALARLAKRIRDAIKMEGLP